MNKVLRFFVNLFERLPICFLGRCLSCRCFRAKPPVCFLMVFGMFFEACSGDFFFETTSSLGLVPWQICLLVSNCEDQ